MVGHVEKMFNNLKLMGAVGAIIGGAFGASSAMTLSVVYRMGNTTGDWSGLCTSYSGLTPDQFLQADADDPRNLLTICQPYEAYNWFVIAPAALTAALAGAFIVLLGVGILRKVYRT
jgi:hypothetical protein